MDQGEEGSTFPSGRFELPSCDSNVGRVPYVRHGKDVNARNEFARRML